MAPSPGGIIYYNCCESAITLFYAEFAVIIHLHTVWTTCRFTTSTVCNLYSTDLTHGFFDVAGENVDLEFLGAPVTLREGEAVAFYGALLAPGTEQHLVDGKRGDLCPRGLIHNPGERSNRHTVESSVTSYLS